jgi:hypothetical protein
MARGRNALGAACAVCGAAGWGFSPADALAALEEGVANKWGSCDRATRGHSGQLRPARRSSFQATVPHRRLDGPIRYAQGHLVLRLDGDGPRG